MWNMNDCRPYVAFAAADPVLRVNDKTKTVGTKELRYPAALLRSV